MGLKNITVRNLKKAQRIISALEHYGVSEEDIPLIKDVKNLKERVDSLEKDVKAISTKSSSESIAEAIKFNSQVEEFYPHGRNK